MTIKHWMLLGGLIGACVGAPFIQGQDNTQNPGTPASPPLIPAAPEQPPVVQQPSSEETKTPGKKNAAPRKSSVPRKAVADLHPGTAVATERNVNVRGQAMINSEVVTHLKRGDVVTVLEQVTTKNVGPDEPVKWARIILPGGSGVWIHAGFIDRDSKTVKANRLNLRSGPGENYSVLGRIDRGAVVNEIETKGEWIKIEAPTNASAFVAAHLLSQEPAQLAAVQKKAPPVEPQEIAARPPVIEKPLETVAVQPPPVVPAPDPIVVPPPAPIPEVKATAVNPPVQPPEPAPPVEEPTDEAEPLIKRVVTREGIVRGSASIQAPTYFVLRSLGNNKTINYLHTVDTNIVLRAFQHQRVVVVGEEILDERWPNTPVIDVESIEPVP